MVCFADGKLQLMDQHGALLMGYIKFASEVHLGVISNIRVWGQCKV